MKALMTGVVNRLYTFLTRTLLSAARDDVFEQALDRAVKPWIKGWDEPEFLGEFPMPPTDMHE